MIRDIMNIDTEAKLAAAARMEQSIAMRRCVRPTLPPFVPSLGVTVAPSTTNYLASAST